MRAKLWPDKHPSEKRTATFDFSDELDVGESVSTATITVAVIDGTDASPSSLLSGALQVQTPLVLQSLKDGVDGCTYGLACLATTSSGNVKGAFAVLTVRQAWAVPSA